MLHRNCCPCLLMMWMRHQQQRIDRGTSQQRLAICQQKGLPQGHATWLGDWRLIGGWQPRKPPDPIRPSKPNDTDCPTRIVVAATVTWFGWSLIYEWTHQPVCVFGQIQMPFSTEKSMVFPPKQWPILGVWLTGRASISNLMDILSP